ncbi:hypothetical protein E7742_11180 [Rhodococcus sp. SGAir0479]|nr:hypothetical protein E7742_11180 [Rhodococcus sp. SGAir0479]
MPSSSGRPPRTLRRRSGTRQPPRLVCRCRRPAGCRAPRSTSSSPMPRASRSCSAQRPRRPRTRPRTRPRAAEAARRHTRTSPRR